MTALKKVRVKLLIYLGIPAGLHVLMVCMYFSGNDLLQAIVAPRSFNAMRPDSGREFGLLENLQHLFILAIAGACAWAAWNKPSRWEKFGFGFVGMFAIFIFLEEIDYGLHYHEYFKGIEWHESADVRNLHNQGDMTDIMKRTVDISIVVLFIFVAWGFGRSRYALLRYLAPDKWFTVTLLCMTVMRLVVHELGDRERDLAGPLGQVGAISRANLSEFREFFVYYIFMIYLMTLAFIRDYRVHATPAQHESVQRRDTVS